MAVWIVRAAWICCDVQYALWQFKAHVIGFLPWLTHTTLTRAHSGERVRTVKIESRDRPIMWEHTVQYFLCFSFQGDIHTFFHHAFSKATRALHGEPFSDRRDLWTHEKATLRGRYEISRGRYAHQRAAFRRHSTVLSQSHHGSRRLWWTAERSSNLQIPYHRQLWVSFRGNTVLRKIILKTTHSTGLSYSFYFDLCMYNYL